MRCIDEIPAPDAVPPLPDSHPPPSDTPPRVPPVPPTDDDDDPLPPPVRLPGRPGVPERVARPGARRPVNRASREAVLRAR